MPEPIIGTYYAGGGENSQSLKKCRLRSRLPVAYRRMKKLIPQLLGGAPPKPTKTVYTVLRQLVQWIPSGMIQRLADEHRLDIRKWSAVSHVVALLYGQLAGCDSLNGIVDAARVHEGEWRNIRGAEPPKRNTFSNANRRRNADMAERLYWEVFGHLVAVCPEFGQYRRHKGFLARMRRGIFAIDSSTIRLCLKGTQADLPDPRLRRLQRERGQVAGLDGAARPPAAALHAARRGLDAQLLAPRGRRARRGVGEARTGRHPQNLWDSTAAQTG